MEDAEMDMIVADMDDELLNPRFNIGIGGGAVAPEREHREGVREFFRNKLPVLRAKQKTYEMREARRDAVDKARRDAEWRIAMDVDMAVLDKILYEGDAVYDQEDEFAYDAEQWLEMRRDEGEMPIHGYIPENESETAKRKRGEDTLEDEARARRRVRYWFGDESLVRQPRYLGYQPNAIGAGDAVYRGASVADGVNIPGINIPMVYDGVPVGGPPLPPDVGSVEMVAVEVEASGEFRPVIDVSIPHPDGGDTTIAVNPFSPEELAATLEKTRESPFVFSKKRKYKAKS